MTEIRIKPTKQVERANPLGRTFTRLVGTSTAQEVRGRRLTAVFVDEPAYGPGVRREAVEVLWDALAQPGYCLLEGFQEGRIFYPRCGSEGKNATSHDADLAQPLTPHLSQHSPLSAVANPELWKHYFVFMGRLLGFALRERLLVLLPLPTVLFKVG